jgi:hypothetical protein
VLRCIKKMLVRGTRWTAAQDRWARTTEQVGAQGSKQPGPRLRACAVPFGWVLRPARSCAEWRHALVLCVLVGLVVWEGVLADK